ncbi:hypothetical protein DFH11DRAFT_1608353 [Phellopilus nigrolimitatus]|nr:hypothetical protein DFH11DRAFT_1625416 [Phellopilus nigrolimitatus]KAH8112180.1 hypothetical protein DFH11DRAFT_1608353 [Phellopilus nigrolimitatus]
MLPVISALALSWFLHNLLQVTSAFLTVTFLVLHTLITLITLMPLISLFPYSFPFFPFSLNVDTIVFLYNDNSL